MSSKYLLNFLQVAEELQLRLQKICRTLMRMHGPSVGQQ